MHTLHPPRDRRGKTIAQVGIAVALISAPAAAGAPDWPRSPDLSVLSPGRTYIETDGASLYANVCQGCHMPDGRGAVGAAAYPALAGNANLQSEAYVLQVIVKGLKGMPPVGRAMTDDQVAAVLTYVRSRFGGIADGPVTAADAAAIRAAKDQ